MIDSVYSGKGVWQCKFCGKRSFDQNGYNPIGIGWDESCSINAAFFPEQPSALDIETIMAPDADFRIISKNGIYVDRDVTVRQEGRQLKTDC